MGPMLRWFFDHVDCCLPVTLMVVGVSFVCVDSTKETSKTADKACLLVAQMEKV